MSFTLPGPPDVPCYQITEFQTEPDRDILERVGICALMVRQEFRFGPGEDDKPLVGGLVLNLTGRGKTTGLQAPFPGTLTHGLVVHPVVRNLCDEDAAATLAGIATGQWGRCVLPWVPLLKGGGDPATITRWLELAAQEPDAHLRSEYASLALTFAELTKGLVDWQKALENWDMTESQFINGFIRQGKQEGFLEGLRTVLLDLIRARLQDPVPDEIRRAAEGTNDPDKLREWILASGTAPTLAEFRTVMKTP